MSAFPDCTCHARKMLLVQNWHWHTFCRQMLRLISMCFVHPMPIPSRRVLWWSRCHARKDAFRTEAALAHVPQAKTPPNFHAFGASNAHPVLSRWGTTPLRYGRRRSCSLIIKMLFRTALLYSPTPSTIHAFRASNGHPVLSLYLSHILDYGIGRCPDGVALSLSRCPHWRRSNSHLINLTPYNILSSVDRKHGSR